MEAMKKLYKAFLIITAINAVNLSMIFFYTKQFQKIRSKNLSQSSIIDQILATPQIVDNKKESQMMQLEKSENINIAIVDGFAYWAEDNVLYRAELKEDGQIDADIAEAVDVMSMSEREINKITKIVDSINN